MTRPLLLPTLPLLTRALVGRILPFVAAQIAYLFNCRSPERPRVFVGMRRNLWLPLGVAVTIALQMAFTHARWMNTLFWAGPHRLVGVRWAPPVLVGPRKTTLSLAAMRSSVRGSRTRHLRRR
ncbi:cation transporting ATPase C-terminal domain-containing protein [Actinokineospora guangxiensis]|uniref:Cation transporting ATPase C-terminal domain-containing protein n=1 Tax=Actinokineospora guangxiensis TaxID=1490288 RepID=A0ABW0EV74_9PSEU